MRRPINWFVFVLSIGFLFLGRALQAPRPGPIDIERTPIQPTLAAAVPAGLRRHTDLEFGYIERERER